MTDIKNQLDEESGEGENFLYHIKSILGPGIYSKHKTIQDRIEALMKKKVFDVGNYDGLKNICRDSGNLDFIDIIDECEKKMKHVQSRHEQKGKYI